MSAEPGPASPAGSPRRAGARGPRPLRSGAPIGLVPRLRTGQRCGRGRRSGGDPLRGSAGLAAAHRTRTCRPPAARARGGRPGRLPPGQAAHVTESLDGAACGRAGAADGPASVPPHRAHPRRRGWCQPGIRGRIADGDPRPPQPRPDAVAGSQRRRCRAALRGSHWMSGSQTCGRPCTPRARRRAWRSRRGRLCGLAGGATLRDPGGRCACRVDAGRRRGLHVPR